MIKTGEHTLKVMSAARKYNSWLMTFIRPHLGEKILETGAGIGNFSDLLSRYGELTATDIDNEYLPKLKKKNFRTGYADIESGKYFFSSREKFDSIINLNVIEHIKNDNQVLRNFFNLLEPGGRLIILTPAHNFAYSKIDQELGHHRRYNLKAFEGKLRKAGFRVVQKRHLNALGLLGWFVAGKIMKKESLETYQLSIFEKISSPFLYLEKVFKFSVGLSIFVVAEKPKKDFKAKSLSIVIPVYNEERTVEELIKKVKKVKLVNRIKKEIVVVNDGSTDQTRKILRKIGGIKYVEHRRNKGKGAAVLTGIKSTSGDVIVIQDADLEYNPESFNKLLRPIIRNVANVVYGTRLRNLKFSLIGEGRTPLPFNFFANKFLTFVTNLLFQAKLTDMETCYKMFRKDSINPEAFVSKGFEIEPELTAYFLKRQEKIAEVSIAVSPRGYNEGKKIKPIDGVRAVGMLFEEKFSK